MKYLLLILGITILFVGCKEEKNCLSFSSNTGLIAKEQNMTKCYSVMVNDKYLITDTTEYKKLPSSTIDSIQLDLGCASNPDRPDIDFNTYFLVGAKTLAKGCIVTYSRDISFNETSHILQYNIDVHQCGDCNEERYNMNWVLIQNDDVSDSLNVSIIDSLNVNINYYIESN